jgi:hypothetical protein
MNAAGAELGAYDKNLVVKKFSGWGNEAAEAKIIRENVEDSSFIGSSLHGEVSVEFNSIQDLINKYDQLTKAKE